MKTLRKFFFIFPMLLVFVMYGCENDETFEVWDTNGNDALSKSEFEKAFSNAEWVAKYDKNKSDFFESDEFILASFDFWDSNDDDIIEEAEYDYGVDYYYPYGVYDYGRFGYYYDWDLDDNNILEEDEFEAAFTDTDIFAVADNNSDNKLSTKEISNLVFRAMDENENELISEDEFGEDVLITVSSKSSL